MNKLTSCLLFLFLTGSALPAYSQLYSDHRISEHEMVHGILTGEEMSIRNVLFRGTSDAIGAFKNHNTNLPLDSGIILSTGRIRTISAQNVSDGATGLLGGYGDKDLSKLADAPTFDATVLMFDFQPRKEIIKFRYVFGSEEYPEYVDKGFNDVFAFFLIDLETGDTTNLAVLPETDEPVSIDRINSMRYNRFYIDNTDFKPHSVTAKTIEFDGFTKPLLAYSEVIPDRNYRIKIAVADAGDAKLDSGVFLEGGSFMSKDREEFYAENKKYFSKFESERQKLLAEDNETDTLTEADTAAKNITEQTPDPDIDADEERIELVLHFDFDQDIPAKKEVEELNQKLRKIADRENLVIEIRGHTDNFGSEQYNDNLSERRAEWAEQHLKDLGFTGKFRIHYLNFSKPASDNSNAKGRADNRRVEIEIGGR